MAAPFSNTRGPVPCIRCQQDLPGQVAYCPACGSPQLRVTEEEIAAAAAALASASTPRSPDMTLIQWPAAVSVSMTSGIAAGVLSSALVGSLQMLMVLWTIAGATCGVALYSRRFPRAWIGGGVGGRIGLLSGIFCASVSSFLTSISLLAQRFLFGQGQQIDNAMNEAMRQYLRFSNEMTQPGQQDMYLKLLNTSVGHSVLLVTTMIGMFLFTLVLSSIAGILSGHFFAVKRRVQSPAN